MRNAVTEEGSVRKGQRTASCHPPVRVGLVGAGVFGGYHGWKVHDHPAAQLAGVHDVDEAAAQALSDKFGATVARGFADLLDRVDAVLITTPAPTHGDLALQALNAGKHVFVEKPMALSLDVADAMIARALDAARVLQVGHQERYVAAALGLFDCGAIPAKMISRRCMPATGRGEDVSVVMDLMIHDLDLTACLYGEGTPVTVQSAQFSEAGHRVDAQLRAGPAKIDLTVSRRSKTRERSLQLDFAGGAVQLDFLNRTLTNTTDMPLKGGFADDDETDQQPLGLRDPLAYGFDHFMTAIKAADAGAPVTQEPAQCGRRALALAIAVECAAGLRDNPGADEYYSSNTRHSGGKA